LHTIPGEIYFSSGILGLSLFGNNDRQIEKLIFLKIPTGTGELAYEVSAMQKDKNTLLNGLSTAASIGFYLASSVAAGILLGRFFDGDFDISPWGTVWGIVLGMVAGMWAMYKKVVGGR